MITNKALFSIGQVVHHKLFNYTGLIYEVDPCFMLSEQWYQQVAKSRPAKDKPWYQVLVSNGIHTTYVAEQNLEAITHFQTINHPDIERYFSGIRDGRYLLKRHFMQ